MKVSAVWMVFFLTGCQGLVTASTKEAETSPPDEQITDTANDGNDGNDDDTSIGDLPNDPINGSGTPPLRSDARPGQLAPGTITTTLGLMTNGPAQCAFALTAGALYGAMTAFTQTGGTSHQTSITGLADGTSYTYYVRCRGADGGINADDFSISFRVLSAGEVVCEATGADCFYASPTGAGTTCSMAAPCKVRDALDKLGGGDYLYLLDGIYSEYYVAAGQWEEPAIINLHKYFNFKPPAATATAPIVIKTYPGSDAIIEGDWTTNNHCVLIDGEDYVTFDGLKIRNCWESGIRIGIDQAVRHVTVRNSIFNEIVGNDNMGGVFVNPGTSDVTIINNVFFDHYYFWRGPSGQQVAQPYSTKPLLETGDCWGAGLILFVSNNVTISGNEFYRTCMGMYYKHGEQVEGGGGFTRIIGNYLHDTHKAGDPGIGIAVNQNRSEIRGNRLDGCGVWLHNEDGTVAEYIHDVKIEFNTLYKGNIMFPWQHSTGAFSGPRNITVQYNILYDSQYDVWAYGTNAEYDSNVQLHSDYNCYFVPSGAQAFDYFRSDNWGSEGGTYNLSQWQLQKFDTHSVEVNPQLVSPQTGDYTTAANSPCAAMGAYAMP